MKLPDKPLSKQAHDDVEALLSYCYECLKDLHPDYNCVECAACGFLLCADGCTLCLCETMKHG